jgi:hypothetical protein
MSLRFAAALAVTVAALVGGAACQVERPNEASGAITITVEPNPVVIRVACLASVPPPEFCLASLDPTITVAETGGVGGRIELIELIVRNTSTGTEEGRVTLDPTWIRTQAGTDRLEAGGRLAFRPVVSGYRVRNGTVPQLVFTITVKFVDDHGNIISQTQQVGGA